MFLFCVFLLPAPFLVPCICKLNQFFLLPEFLTKERLQETIQNVSTERDSDAWVPEWIVRYSGLIKCRGIINMKGYILHATRDNRKRILWWICVCVCVYGSIECFFFFLPILLFFYFWKGGYLWGNLTIYLQLNKKDGDNNFTQWSNVMLNSSFLFLFSSFNFV